MNRKTLMLAFCGLLLSANANAAVSGQDLPDGTIWYLHADLATMRTTDSGRELYRWLEGEVIAEVREEIGIDLNEEADRITAFSTEGQGTVIIVEGQVRKESKDKLLALAQLEAPLDIREYKGSTYYFAGEEEREVTSTDLDDLEESAYFTFDIKDKVIVASSEEQLKALMDSKGRVAGAGKHKGALFVMTAEKEFVQAGMRTGEFADDDGDWDSNILRNTEQAALLVSDVDGKISIEAQLVSTDPKMAESIASIVSGLISLQAFNAGLDSQIAQVLQATKVRVLDNVLSVSTVLEPAMVLSVIDH
jgi:transcriptional regulator with XRE-family HTH domain